MVWVVIGVDRVGCCFGVVIAGNAFVDVSSRDAMIEMDKCILKMTAQRNGAKQISAFKIDNSEVQNKQDWRFIYAWFFISEDCRAFI
jgi:hypothetical protein